ncbi:MAG: tetratricopeptide repeat protein [Akkermansiaceae bacterium]
MTEKQPLYLVVILVLIGSILYSKSISFDYVSYDDTAYVYENHFVKQGLTEESIQWAFLYQSQAGELSHRGIENLWHPLTWISHMLDVELYGINTPGGHHGTNLILYLMTIPLVFWSSYKLLGNIWAGFIVALIWTVHPLKVESVAWISERKDILSGLFFWASLSCAIKSISSSKIWERFGLAFFVAALLSKASVVILPALLILISGYLKKEKTWGISFIFKESKRWALWFAAAIVISLISIVMQSGGSHEFFIERSSLIGRLTTTGSAFWFYIYRIIVPWDLNFYYEYPRLHIAFHLVAWLGLITLVFLTWLKRNSNPTLFIGIFWFLICLVPVSGIFYTGSSFTTDRYVYIALAGLLFPLATTITQRKKITWIIVPLPLLYCILSWNQLNVWKNSWTLFTHSTEARPEAEIGWTNLATLQKLNNQYDEAIISYHKAIKVNSLSYIAWYNLGVIYEQTGDISTAAEKYQHSLEIYPNYLPAALNLGLIKKNSGDTEAAKELFYRGNEHNVKMLWLSCECEMLLHNFDAAQLLINKLDTLNIQHPDILKRLAQAKKILSRMNNKNFNQ